MGGAAGRRLVDDLRADREHGIAADIVPDRSVAEVCFTVGLTSDGSFTTSFGREFGVSPTAYRATYPPASHRARPPPAWSRPPAARS